MWKKQRGMGWFQEGNSVDTEAGLAHMPMWQCACGRHRTTSGVKPRLPPCWARSLTLASSCPVNFPGVLWLHFPSSYRSAGIADSHHCLQLYLSFRDLNLGLLHTSIKKKSFSHWTQPPADDSRPDGISSVIRLFSSNQFFHIVILKKMIWKFAAYNLLESTACLESKHLAYFTRV